MQKIVTDKYFTTTTYKPTNYLHQLDMNKIYGKERSVLYHLYVAGAKDLIFTKAL